MDEPGRKSDARQARDQREDARLRQPLAENASIPGAEDPANRKFLSAFAQTRQVEVQQVRRPDQGHATHRAEQNPQSAAHSTEAFLEQRFSDECDLACRCSGLLFGVALREPLHQLSQTHIGDAGLQAADNIEAAIVGLTALAGCRRQRCPVARVAMGKTETRRHHATDGDCLAIEEKAFPENIRTASKSLPPQPVAQKHEVVSP